MRHVLTFKQGSTTIALLTSDVFTAVRFAKGKVNRIVMKYNGKASDFGAKVLRVSQLEDDMFVEFARIQEETQDV